MHGLDHVQEAAQEVQCHLLLAAKHLTMGSGWSSDQSDSPTETPTDSERLSRLLEAVRMLAAVRIPFFLVIFMSSGASIK